MSKPLKQHEKIRTNTKKDSICTVEIEPIQFKALWAGYPSGHPYVNAKGETPPGFENQCAIKVSVALHAAGIQMKSFRGATVIVRGNKAATSAEGLAAWLKQQPFCGLPPKPEDITGKDWKEKINGRTGIIFFKDYWLRDGETAGSGTGDHIDLWNKDTLSPSVQSFLRFRIGIRRVANPLDWVRGRDGNWYSDLDKSKGILFWEIK